MVDPFNRSSEHEPKTDVHDRSLPRLAESNLSDV
jgi:hypothetical protein